MMHLRVNSPAESTGAVLEVLRSADAVANLALFRGAAQDPPGDVLTADVAREGVTEVVDLLRGLGIDRSGSIAVEEVALSLSTAAERAEVAAPGSGSDAVVWQQIEQRTGDEARLSGAYIAFFVIATIIAGVGVLLDQPILIVGAMVVGPEFGPLAALCVGLVRGRRAVIGRAAATLAIGFAVAMAAAVVATWAMDAIGVVDREMLLRPRPLTDFIWRPDALSWIVGFLAGAAGMLSLTTAKSGALIGVLISVTTVPAAANVAVATAYGVADEALGSLLQLAVNLAAIVVAGVLTLLVQQLGPGASRRTGLVMRPTPSGAVRRARLPR